MTDRKLASPGSESGLSEEFPVTSALPISN
jgi:hypothetical protein